MKREKIRDRFLEHVSNHKLEILQDDKTYRHLKFTNNGSFIYRFDLITWPGYLAITGDVGCYVFQRIEDMFSFFRSENLEINPGYWGEKLEAVDKVNDYLRFSEDRFREVILEEVRQQLDLEKDEDIPKKLLEELEDQVLYCSDEREAKETAESFQSEIIPEIQFTDFWEYNLKDFTDEFIWCCFAIVWGIQQYDKVKR